MKWIVLILFGAVGAVALWGGVSWGSKRYQLVSSGVPVPGRVVDRVEHEHVGTSVGTQYRESERSFHPLVEFVTTDGETVRIEGTTGRGDKEKIEIGKPVTVVYDPADPSQAVIAEFQQAWLGPLTLSVAGFVFLLMGIGGYILIGRDDDRFPDAAKLLESQRLEMERLRQQQEGGPLPGP